MTEAVFATGEDAAALFEAHDPAPIATIPVLKGGKNALAKANVELGLALADEEIDYLVANSVDRQQPELQIECF